MKTKSPKKPDKRLKLVSKTQTLCKASNCSEPAGTKGLCRLHYLMLLKNPDLLAPNETKMAPKKKSEDVFDSNASSTSNDFSPEEVVEKISNLDAGQTLMIDTLDLDPFKKTG